jgi:hypothetical protein
MATTMTMTRNAISQHRKTGLVARFRTGCIARDETGEARCLVTIRSTMDTPAMIT